MHCLDNRVCPRGYFHCFNSRCVNASLQCNSHNDCGDNSDERSCHCADDEFQVSHSADDKFQVSHSANDEFQASHCANDEFQVIVASLTTLA